MNTAKKWIAGFSAGLFALSACPLLTSVQAADVEREQVLQDTYQQWKKTYVTEDTYISSGKPQYYVSYEENRYAGDGVSVPVTVSEAHGYGMLITVCMADYDTQAKDTFDGMYRYYRAHLSDIGENLMSWQQCDNGSSLIDGATNGAMQGGDADSATDGDLDIAYSLLLADQRWGSSEETPYRETALAMIQDIMDYEVNQEDWLLQLGDWVHECDPSDSYYSATRSSDFILQYFPVFEAVTGDERWGKLYDGTCAVIESITAEQSTGLLPDFIVKNAAGKFVPAPENFLEDVTDGTYAYNSCRTPWRLGMDLLYPSEKGANDTIKTVIHKLNSWIQTETDGEPENIVAGYKLDGTPTQDYDDLCFTAPFLVAAACEDSASSWEQALWDTLADYGTDVYFGDTICMLCMISVTGNWLVPETTTDSTKGDLDRDGTATVSDLVLLNRYLLRLESLTAEQGNRADWNDDQQITVVDAMLMRHSLL